MASLSSLNFRLTANIAPFRKGLNKAERAMDKMGRKMQQTGKNLSMKLTAPLAALGAMSFNVFRDFELEMAKNISLCEHYVSNGLYHVMAASDGDEVVGFASMCESHSLYAEGSFCIIQEFYVMPDYRSKKVGASLMEAVKQYSQAHNWKRIELCTPPVPEFERSVDFYEANGFEKTGGYKMKSIIV